jgi:hypothetical protein
MRALRLTGPHALIWPTPDLESETQHGVCRRCGIAKER